MRWRTVFAEGYWSLAANLSQTIAASLTVLIGMLLLGLFIGLGSWTLAWSNHVKQELTVHVYFTQTATRQQETEFVRRLQSNSYVKAGGIKFVSREEAFKIMARQAPELVSGLPSNPLGDALSLTPSRPET